MSRLFFLGKVVAFAVLLSVHCTSVSLGHGGAEQILAWLEKTGMGTELQNALQSQVRGEAGSLTWLTNHDGQVASLVFRPWRGNRPSPHVRQHELSVARMQANQQLLLFAVDDHYQQYGLTNKAGLANALYRVASSDKEFSGRIMAGAQSAAALLDAGAVALIWTRDDRITVIRQSPPPVAVVESAYCRALYADGNVHYAQKRYEQALQVYKELYDLKCKIPDIYLDSAEAFLQINKPEDAHRLLRYALDSLYNLMSSVQLEQAGSLFLKMEDDQAALSAFDLATQKFESEQRSR